MNRLTCQLDEGGIGVEEHWGTNFALPATAEKGFVNVLITLDMAGGHSSTPPDHTASTYPLTSLCWSYPNSRNSWLPISTHPKDRR
jgi:hypothetical protein